MFWGWFGSGAFQEVHWLASFQCDFQKYDSDAQMLTGGINCNLLSWWNGLSFVIIQGILFHP